MIARLWMPVAALVVWQLLWTLGAVSGMLVPPPTILLREAWALTASGELPRHIGATLARTGVGFVGGAVAGIALGLLMGVRTAALRAVEPLASAITAMPKVVLLPLMLLLLGLGETARIALAGLAVLALVAIHTSDAVRHVRPGWAEMAANYGADRQALVRHVYFPACLPQVFTGLRLALANALVIVISCELVSPTTGLGSMIWLAWQTFSLDRLYVAILVTAALGVLLHESLRLLEQRLVPWKLRRFESE